MMNALSIPARSNDADGATSAAQACRTLAPLFADEKIGVHSIRVMERCLGATAIVGTFFAAERTLHGWSHRREGVLRCDFEILYNDGCKISGAYHFTCKAGRRPALMESVRATARGEQGCCRFSLSGMARSPGAFLDNYETADFADQ
jgi:hypothetical protein